MDAWPALGRLIPASAERSLLARFGPMLAATTFGLLALGGILICSRRASGALDRPLPALVMVALAVTLALAAVLFRRTWAARWPAAPVRYWVQSLPTFVLLCWLAGVTLGGSSVLGVVLLVGTIVAEETWSWALFLRQPEPAGEPRQVAAPPSEIAAAPHTAAPEFAIREIAAAQGLQLLDPADRDAADGEFGEALDETVSLEIVRRREDSGEVIEGWTRVSLAPGERHAAAHIAICPAMAHVPECFAEQADGPGARVKVAQVLPFGVRIDVKLDEPAAATESVRIEFAIRERA